MIALIERLAHDFRRFAPDLVASPKTSLYRIYRDTRFSENKTPYKTHVAAVFPPRGLPKHQGAGMYFHVSPTEVWVGGESRGLIKDRFPHRRPHGFALLVVAHCDSEPSIGVASQGCCNFAAASAPLTSV